MGLGYSGDDVTTLRGGVELMLASNFYEFEIAFSVWDRRENEGGRTVVLKVGEP